MDEKNPFISDSLRATFDKLNHLQNSLPTMKDLIPSLDIKQPELNPILFQAPEVKIPPIGEKLDKICEFNQQLVAENKELISKLEEGTREITVLQREIKKIKDSHKYDLVKEIGLVVISVALTILATRIGWL